MCRVIPCLVFLALCSLALAESSTHTHSHEHAEKMVMDDPHDHDHDKMKDMKDMKDEHKKHMNMTHDMMMMPMYFHFGVKEYILFEEWRTTTAGGMVASAIGVFLMGMLYEGLKYFREHLYKKFVSSIQFSTVSTTGESGRITQVHKVQKNRMLSWQHALQTGLHVVQIVVSYFLMLIFMTYNVWLGLSVVLGSGVGYFVFGWKKASVVDITEHCH
ncbi:high affinity copper uptake protein 1 [Caerostris darwini]|uniref:Copper transport protein n=1 Tax=Caerostris darwini TaxID=1538125 RepID=A0AAV4TC52_9ARAC|nr:high affinity copper uptake protein 1 [Caerostris darwini]